MRAIFSRRVVLIFCVVASISSAFPFSYALAAQSPTVLSGTVLDTEGNPIRAAKVSVDLNKKTVSRLSGGDGRYEFLGLSRGVYRVTVQAYAFESKTQNQEVSTSMVFRLRPRWDLSQVSSAELLTALPENQETRFLPAMCTGCHTLSPMMLKRGLNAAEWEGVITEMATRSKAELELYPFPSGSGLQYTARVLEKYLGPASPEITPNQVKHLAPSEEALKATFYEFEIPTKSSFPHGLHTDNRGNGWFDYFNVSANRIAKLNFTTGEISEYPFPIDNAAPIAAIPDKDGKVWICLRHGNKLAYIDPVTGGATIVASNLPGARKGTFDHHGNFWGSGGDGVYEVDRETGKVTDFPGPVPKQIPAESVMAFTRVPGDSAYYTAGAHRVPLSGGGGRVVAASYEPAVDSKGRIWYATYELGTLNRVDPTTGKTTTFKFPGIPASRGIAVDANDNVWYADDFGGKLVKFDQKTGKAKLYQPPTRYANPYGVVVEQNGTIWFADYTGNNITRFDPKTEQFTEYPIPTRAVMPRFISIDDQGRIWFTEWWQNKVAVLVPNGDQIPAWLGQALPK